MRFSDNSYNYYLSDFGIRIEGHSKDWAGFYNHTLELVGIDHGQPPNTVSISIRVHEDLMREIKRNGFQSPKKYCQF